MSSVTYQTLVPDSLTEFCEAMGQLFGFVERYLYKDLNRGHKLKDLKREYQKTYGINARQFNSIHANLKGKIGSSVECHKRQLNELTSRIEELSKSIKRLSKTLKITKPHGGIGKHKSPKSLSAWQLHQKKRFAATLKAKLVSLRACSPSFIFGGGKLWKAQFNKEANGYSSHEEWLADWRDSRTNQFMLVGSSDETAGCQNCQLSSDGLIKVRVPRALENQFGNYIKTTGINFNYGQDDVNYALANHQALTYRFVRKQGQWYVFVTVDRPIVPPRSRYSNGMLGVDLNPHLIGWSYIDREGNLLATGQIKFNLRDRSTNQVQATLGDACKELVEIALSYQCPIVCENLDFSRKKASMKEQGVRYSRMLSNFSYSQFGAMLASRCERFGIELIRVNPAYSSQIGLVKFMGRYGLSSDTAAALVLARRALRKSERIPAKITLCLPVDRHKHSWSFTECVR